METRRPTPGLDDRRSSAGTVVKVVFCTLDLQRQASS